MGELIQFKSRGSKGEIWMYGPVGTSWEGGMTAADFATQLKGLGNVTDITLRINSDGGDVFTGYTIYQRLREHPAAVNVKIDGLAASIASVIAMAGDTIDIAENGMLMIHDPWSASFGTAEDMRKTADLLDVVKSQIASTYSKRTGMSTEEVGGLMQAETWMDAKTAKASGFVDRIVDGETVAACADLSRFRNVPQKLLARAASAGHARAVAMAAEIDKRMRLWRADAA